MLTTKNDKTLSNKDPLPRTRSTVLDNLGLRPVAGLSDLTSLAQPGKVSAATVNLREVCEVVGGPRSDDGPRKALAPVGHDAVCAAYEQALGISPSLVKECGVAPGAISDLSERYGLCLTIAGNAATARNQGLDALRLGNGLCQVTVNSALRYLRDALQAAPTPAARQALLTQFAPFIQVVNQEYELRTGARRSNDNRVAALGAEADAADESLAVKEIEARLARGQPVSNAECLKLARLKTAAAPKSEVKAPARTRAASGRRTTRG